MKIFKRKKKPVELTDMEKLKAAIDEINNLMKAGVLPKGYTLWTNRDWPRPMTLSVVRFNADAAATPVYETGFLDSLN